MEKSSKRSQKPQTVKPKVVDSLLAAMTDGKEYESIVSLTPKDGNILREIKQGISEVEAIREKPLVCYVANTVNNQVSNISIDDSDDLPFNEMIQSVPDDKKDIDILLVTPGGSGNQISQFVNSLRPRFNEVNFILPQMCMSAGTLWALSGDNIFMDDRAYIGPIDPQVPVQNGGMIPAQSILVLLNEIEQQGEKALSDGNNPPWHLIRLLDTIDPKVIGDAINQSEYSIKLASTFLENYKFKHWFKRSNGDDVTKEMRAERAKWVAKKLCSNEHWKSHGHGITREVANNELKIKIENTDNGTGLEGAIRRLWCLFYYTFEKSMISKMYISTNYNIVRHSQGQK